MVKQRGKSVPLVSVVVASYNHAQFVVAALESVAAQQYPALELIIVDDCSTDASAERIRQWLRKPAVKQRFQRIVFETAPHNAGAHATLNRGAELARGDYLNFLNSDDLFAPQRIGALVEQCVPGQLAWGFTGVEVVDQHGVQLPEQALPPQVGFVYEALSYARAQYPSWSVALLERNIVISTGNVFVARPLWQQLGGFRQLRYVHDWDFVLRATRRVEPLVVDAPLYSYRLHGSNSFKSLAQVAATEGTFILQDHLRQLQLPLQNPLAPSPRNWPVLFDQWIDSLGLRPYMPA